MKAETEAMLLQAEEYQRFQKAARPWGEASALGRNQSCQYLDLGRLASGTLRQYISAF